MRAVFKPSRAVGAISAPPSKSYAHRMMICAALAEGESRICGISQSEDMLATLDCIKALGAEYVLDGDMLTVRGGRKPSENEKIYPCRESGSTLRFFIPLAMTDGGTACFKGSERLIERGIGIYEDALKNISFKKSAGEIVAEGKLTAGCYEVMGNISSQYISGLLLALPLLDESSVIKIIPPVESKNYIGITIDVMKLFGVNVEKVSETEFKIQGGQKYNTFNGSVEGDWSNAAFYYAFNAIGGDVEVLGLNMNSLQGDSACTRLFDELDEAEPVIDISDCPDLGPVLFSVAAAKHGAVFTGTKRLKIKECDRAEAMAEELAKLGINVQVDENSVTVFDGELKAPTQTLISHNDHRIAMALSILMSLTGGVIDDAQAVRKSQPDYFDRLQRLGLEVTYEDRPEN